MNFEKKNTLIILIAGKARSGKGEVAKFLQEKFLEEKKKVIISPYTKYLKKYICEITEKSFLDEDKPRDLLQKISSELIKKRLGNQDFFLRRQIEDLEFYHYFMDVVLIPDVRFPEEISRIKERFSNVVSIGIKREGYVSPLTKEQQEDVTEISLDDYTDYDYFLKNTSLEVLYEKVLEVVRELKKEGRI